MERATAQMVARKTNAGNRRTRERAPRGLEVNAFACRFCGGWHIGTVKK